MLQQIEVTELVEDINRRKDNRSFTYALAVGFITLVITMFGLTMLYSTSFATVGEKYFYAQLKWFFIAIAAMGGVIFIGYKRLSTWTPWLLGTVIILLIWAAFFSRTLRVSPMNRPWVRMLPPGAVHTVSTKRMGRSLRKCSMP